MESTQGVSTPDCPYCERPVDALAEQCSHCGVAFFESKTPDGMSMTPYAVSGRELYANLALLLPLVLTLALWATIALALTQGSVDASQVRTVIYRLQFEGGLVVTLLLALLIGLEAWRLGIGSRQDLNARNIRRSGPFHWFVLTLFAWPLSLLAYLSWRNRYGVKKRFIPGLFVLLVLFGTVWGCDAILGSHPRFQLTNLSAPRATAVSQISTSQADTQARLTIHDMRQALQNGFYRNRRYPTAANDFFSGVNNFNRPEMTYVYLSGGPEYYQLIVFHEKGGNDFLVRSGDNEIYTFPNSDVLTDLADEYGPAAIERKGNLYFIVNRQN